MFSGVLRSILFRRSMIIVFMVVRLVSLLSCLSVFELIFVLVIVLVNGFDYSFRLKSKQFFFKRF